jgi:hypothetical protein
MNQTEDIYHLQRDAAATEMRFFFISRGPKDVIKIINYAFVEKTDGR